MKKDISFSLSIQREIENHGLNVESEVNKAFNELGIRTLLHQAGIRKEKGFPPVTLLFVMVVLPLIKHSLCSLWSGQFFANIIAAQKDTYYRFLNHPCFNLRIPVASGHLFRCKVGHQFRSNLGQAFRCKVVH